MAEPQAPIPDDEPLDPKVEAVQRRMHRMILISRGIMVAGLLTVAAVIFYRMDGGDDTASDTPRAAATGVAHVAISADHVVLILNRPDGTQAVRVQTLEGRLVSETVLP